MLHRTARGWMPVGQTSFGSPDMDEALSYLRSTALGLSPGGVASKLIIPNDQILYISVHAPGPDAAKRRKQIAVALEGRTPYAVADLVFDWWGKGDEVNVAVIARETLDEAEGFAHAHRFNPLSFVAVPDNGLFQGEPWFGPTRVADQILAPGEKVDRDQDPVRILGRDLAQEPEAKTAAVAGLAEPVSPPVPEPIAAPLIAEVAAEPVEVAAPQPPPPTPEPVAQTYVPPAFEPALKARPAPAPAPAAMPEPVATPPVQSAAAALDPLPDWSPVQIAAPAQAPLLAPLAAERPQDLPSPAPMTADEPFEQVTSAQPMPAPAQVFAADEAPMALDVDDEVANAAPPATAAKPKPEPALGFSLLRAFTSRRKDPAPAAPVKAEPSIAAPAEANLAATLAASLTARPAPAPPKLSISTEVSTPAPAPVSVAPPRNLAPESSGMAVVGAAGAAQRPMPAPGKLTAERPSLARPLPGQALAKGNGAKAAKGLRGFGAFVTSPSIDGAKKPRAALPSLPAGTQLSANPSGLSPARPATRPIGLGTKPIPRRGKPRYLGLILTCILLVLLALVAAWASYFIAFNDGQGASTTEFAATEQSDLTDLPAPEDEMLADMQDPADFTEAGTSDTADIALTEPALALEAAPQTGLVSETGASAVTPAGDAQDEIFLAGIDTAPQPPDPSALGAPAARTDALPDLAAAPPPFGTIYQFDADGQIIPTPEGITTPEGVLLVAGRPALVPTSRPAAVVAAAAARLPAAAVPEAEAPIISGNPSTVPIDPAATGTVATDAAEPDAPAFADPALKGLRPLPRPASLQVPSQTGSTEDPTLAPGSDSRFASLRPQPRPAAIVALAAPNVDQAAIESAVQSASLVVGGQVLPQDVSPLAISVSLIPAARPAELEQTASLQEASANTSDQSAAEADSEPENDGAMPSLPTSASVAKQATVKNAVNLSELTLIGIYGTENSRYALVRQPNGRMVKVKVGDKLDGGKVVALATSVLTYQKSGRTVTLEMPRT